MKKLQTPVTTAVVEKAMKIVKIQTRKYINAHNFPVTIEFKDLEQEAMLRTWKHIAE